MGRDLETAAPRLGPGSLFMTDYKEGPDLFGAGEAVRPLADLCIAPDAETPFALALVGGRGTGKSFALRRLLEEIEKGAKETPSRLARVVVARVEAAGAGAPAAAIAAAVHRALTQDNQYAQLAEDAAHATVDPGHAAAAAAERHDETLARLEQERRARDEVEGRRARLADSLLFETPGSRVDAFARAGRAGIEAKLRRFGFDDGDADVSYRRLVRDLHGLRASSRVGVFLRAIFVYRGQMRLLVLAVLAFVLAFGLAKLRGGLVDDFGSQNAQLGSALDWMKAHDETLEYVGEGLFVAGLAAVLANLWRAASFTGLLFRGLRMLHLDLRERRRELDASAARLERRVAALQMEADAAQNRAETLARKAGGAAAPHRVQAPAFLSEGESPEAAARAFLAELGRAMAAGATAAPQRLVVALDGLDTLSPEDTRRFLETAKRLAGPCVAVIAAADVGRLGPDVRGFCESLFDAALDVEALGTSAGMRGAGRLLEAPSPAAPSEPRLLSVTEPLEAPELEFLKTSAALIGPRPRTLKRFYNAYRLARMAEVPRGALALSLAALMAPDPSAASALRWTLEKEGPFVAPASPAPLRDAFEALSVQGIGRDAARGAFEAARRFAPWG
jgi:hypothetical protein